MAEALESSQNAESLFSAVRLVMKALRAYIGLDPSGRRVALRRAGGELGHAISRLMKSKDTLNFLDELTTLWNEQSLGDMEVISMDPVVLEVRNCYDCFEKAYGIGETLCAFKEGLIQALVEDRLGVSGLVTETECCGTFAKQCRFKLSPSPST